MNNSDPLLKFQTFDFFGNPQFISYFEGLYPTPTLQQQEKIKRKWYKNKIDPEFDIEFDKTEFKSNDFEEEKKPFNNPFIGEKKQNSQFEEEKKTNNDVPNQAINTPKLPFMQNTLFALEAYLKFSFMISFLGFKILANYLGITISILALLRQGKMPKLTKEYGRKIIFSEHFHNLFYFALFLFYGDFLNFFYFLPMMIHCWIGLCNYAFITKGKIYLACQKQVDKTRLIENHLIILKQKFEIFLLLWFIIKLFTMHFSATLILIYGGYIRSKYHLNENMKKAFGEIDSWIRGYIETPKVPRFVKRIYDQFVRLCAYAVRIN